MLVFEEGGKLENLEKNPQSKARNNDKLNPHMAPGQNCTQTTFVGGKRSVHCTSLAPHTLPIVKALQYITSAQHRYH